MRAHCPTDGFAVGAGDRRLACRIDFGHDQRVYTRKHAREVIEQVARSRVAMRLECQQNASAGPALTNGFQGRGQLGWMMAIVIDERDRAIRRSYIAVLLQPTIDSLEADQRGLNGGVRNVELSRN